ncbi:hypothetical protein TNCV_2843671 [Trichonephila clavipes]|nr:hypothetical protein TNCV_2843671 [Trichonephila clavipes]
MVDTGLSTIPYSDYLKKKNLSPSELKDLKRPVEDFFSCRIISSSGWRNCNPALEESILNVVADRPESSTRAVTYASLSHQTISDKKSHTPLPFSAGARFQFGRVSSPTASGWYRNVPCSWTSQLNSYEQLL